MTKLAEENYLHYLTKISWKGRMYRKHFLYPKLGKYCSGQILDIGCGTGQFLEFLGTSNAHGVDVNQFCVELCKSKGLTASKMEPDQLPFEDNKFNSLTLDNVLEHIAEPKKLILECNRVLKQNGTLLIGVPGTKGFLKDLDHKSFFDLAGVYNLGLRNGFFPKSYFYAPFGPLIKNINSFCLYVVLTKYDL